MTEAIGTPVVKLDGSASEPLSPFGIITVDCSDPYEYDDGIAVSPLDAARESYQVHVFAVDTSPYYLNQGIVNQVLERTESVYRDGASSGQQYIPMLDTRLIRKLHFMEGATRDALAVSFTIGPDQPPSDIEIGFGKVTVTSNLRYDSFGERCRSEEAFMPYGRVAALIMKHLHAPEESIEEVHHELMYAPDQFHTPFGRGSQINHAYMVAAGHFVAATMRDEDRLAIYRTHDRSDSTYIEIVPPNIALFSRTPGWHDGLNLPVYTRITSSLRRAEDFIMMGLLRARHEGRPMDKRDEKNVAKALQRLNQREVRDAFRSNVRISKDDSWYKPMPREETI